MKKTIAVLSVIILAVLPSCTNYQEDIRQLAENNSELQAENSELITTIDQLENEIQNLRIVSSRKNEELLGITGSLLNNPFDFPVIKNVNEVEQIFGPPNEVIIDDTEKEPIGMYEFGDTIEFLYDDFKIYFTNLNGMLLTIFTITNDGIGLKNGLTTGISKDTVLSMMGIPEKFNEEDEEISYSSANRLYVLDIKFQNDIVSELKFIENM